MKGGGVLGEGFLVKFFMFMPSLGSWFFVFFGIFPFSQNNFANLTFAPFPFLSASEEDLKVRWIQKGFTVEPPRTARGRIFSEMIWAQTQRVRVTGQKKGARIRFR